MLDALDEYTEDWNDLLYFITRLSMPSLKSLSAPNWVHWADWSSDSKSIEPFHWVDCSADRTSIEPFVSAKIDEDINACFLMDEQSEDLLIRKVTSNCNGS